MPALSRQTQARLYLSPQRFDELQEAHVLTKAKLAFGEASKMKKHMLDRYSGDGYYFLEDYIDGMMDKSEVYFKSHA